MAYDALNRCVSLCYNDGAVRLVTWLYDGLNRPTIQYHWNGALTTWAYDPRGLPALIRHSTSGAALLEFASYTYDEARKPLTRATNGSKITTWTYDLAAQLKSEWHSGGTIDTFTWDAAGNRFERLRSVAGALTIATAMYDAAGQWVTMLAGTARTTFAYDLNGNLRSEFTAPTGTTTYTWDALDRLIEEQVPAGTRTTYIYCFDDLRSAIRQVGGRSTFVWDVPGATGYGDLLEELDTLNQPVRTYYRGFNLAALKEEASGSYAYHWIDEGTAQLLTDASQAVTDSFQFSAWGELMSASVLVETPLSWNGDWGYYRDTGARTWVRARHLDVQRGRWMSMDPIGFADEVNLYGYVGNDPVNWVDPSGTSVPPKAALDLLRGTASFTLYRSGPGGIVPYATVDVPIGARYYLWFDPKSGYEHIVAPGYTLRLHRLPDSSGSPSVETGNKAVDRLHLAPDVAQKALALTRCAPHVQFTSGRRDWAHQARAMAGNVVQKRGYIIHTYNPRHPLPVVRAMQQWVNDNPQARKKKDIAAGLLGVMKRFPPQQVNRISKHMSGRAFDIQPHTAPVSAVKALHGHFIQREAGLLRWHVDFK